MTTEPVTASYITTPRQAGRTKAMIDVLLTQANEHGIRIEIVEPVTPEHVDAAAEAIFKLRYQMSSSVHRGGPEG